MGWTWELSDRAADRLDKLDSGVQQRILDKLDAVTDDEFRDPPGFAKQLTEAGSWHTVRVGDFRAVVRFDHETRVMQVGTVGHRSTIYDDFP